MNNRRILNITLVSFLILGVNAGVHAGELSISHTFQGGTRALASEVNENFNSVKIAVDDNNTRITQLETALEELRTELQTSAKTIEQLQADLQLAQDTIEGIQQNSVLALDGYLIFDVDVNGYERALFSGLNVQVINGTSQLTPNGLGNLIVGYNSPRREVAPWSNLAVCSMGQFQTRNDCELNGGIWAVDHKSGSHNLVAGNNNAYSQTGGIVFGNANAIANNYSAVLGGAANAGASVYGTVSGGVRNHVYGSFSTITGGGGNVVHGARSSISGGRSITINSSADYDWAAGTLFEDH